RAYAPGQHGQARIKLSNYGLQLREKQKVKRIYGVLERQFRKYFAMAERAQGVTGKVLLQLLERRLDNTVFRMGLAVSRTQARQFVRHNMIKVNARRVNIPSFLVAPDDKIEVHVKDRTRNKLKENLVLTKDRGVPSWLDFSEKDWSAKIVRLPEKDDIQQPIHEQLIVELYSK
ncbi:MAG: 30S ribosomal protein S4, partial [Candidatus Omnitrophica bacterium]|nr:30S ribosomal protein S4 [Candidatus Omnitrophota bacterium]